jgi:hypothetical protein
MDNFNGYFGTFATDGSTHPIKVPLPENLKNKDGRADPVAKAALLSANAAIDIADGNDAIVSHL